MPSQFFALIFAENFFDLVFATYLALRGKRVAVVAAKDRLQNSADSLLLDPFRSRLVCDWLGLQLKAEKHPYIPDFHLISPGRRLELFWDRPRREFALERDLGRDWKKFSGLIDRLVELGSQCQERVKQLQLVHFKFGADLVSRLFSRASPGFGQGSLGELLRQSGVSDVERQLVLAPLKLFSPYFQESSPLFSAALLWRFLLATGEGSTGEDESWEGIFEILEANGALVQEQPFALVTSGKKLSQLKLRTGRAIEADFFFAEPNRVFFLLDELKRESRQAKSLMGKFPRATFFSHVFRMDSELWPEPMSQRVLWVPGLEKEPKEFLLIARGITPSTLQLSISYAMRKGETKPLEPTEIFDALKGLFPWLTEKKFESRSEPVAFHQHLKFHPSELGAPKIKTSFTNLYLSPSELVPLFGLAGIFRLAQIMEEMDRE